MATKVGKVISVPEPTTALIAPAAKPASVIRIACVNGTETTVTEPVSSTASQSAGLGFPLLAHPHIDTDRAAFEAERLTQPPFQEAAVTGF
jgi:hypothetical protein